MDTTTAPAPEFVTEKELAARLGVSPGSLRLDRHRGVGLPYVRLTANRIRYRLADVESYLAANTVVPQHD